MGSGHPQPHAVLMLAEDLRTKLDQTGVREEVGEALGDLLRRVNGEVERHERLEFLAVAKEDWLIENGFLTPTMKIKRSILEDRYGPNIEKWYRVKQEIIWEA
jgi:long-chain acyl-CoA synthetase